MKTNRFIFFIISLITLSIIFGIRTSANVSDDGYIVSESGGVYSLYISGAESERLCESFRLSDIISVIPGGASVAFDSVSVSENIILPLGDYRFGGSIKLSSGGVITVPEGATLTLSDINIDIPKASDGYVRVKGGGLNTESGTVISSEGGVPIVLDFSADALVNLFSGSITSSRTPCVNAKSGRVNIIGASLSSASSAAVKSSATLALGGGASVVGSGIDIETEAPIRNSYGTEYYTRELRVKFLALFASGSMTEVLYNTSAESSQKVKVYDENGTLYQHRFFAVSELSDERNFSAVYLPHRVSYYCKGEKIHESEILGGLCAEPIEYTLERGYYFSGWYSDESLSVPFDFSSPVNSDVSVYLEKRLEKPSFSLSSLSFTYDTLTHTLGFGELSHPLGESGIFSFEWYKNNQFISSAKELKITEVKESGSYFCKLKFSYNGDFVEIVTPEVSVTVKKKTVALPTIQSKAYTGYTQYPDIDSSRYYTAVATGGVDASDYPVRLTLNDPDNYRWESSETAFIDISFSITRAKNLWREEVSVTDSYVGFPPQISCKAAFGEVKYLFSLTASGEYSMAAPSAEGSYYLVCEVVGTDNYEGLRSEPIAFNILGEKVLGMYIERMPDKTEYTAFERFLPTGISVVVDYNSGRQLRIGAESLGISYTAGDSFRFGDSSVMISYGGVSLPVSVSVKRAEYDISDIVFRDREVVYSGEYNVISYFGELPLGKDGIALSASVVGGGVGVGEYSLSLVFSTNSENYKTPEPILAKLTILPMPVRVTVDSVEFVYNGSPQAPYAYFLNENAIRVPVTVFGAKTNAGEGYVATFVSPTGNYTLDITEVSFGIRKADYDVVGVRLDNRQFVYDGTEKTVNITGLPEGVGIIGYTDNFATNAGVYTVNAMLSYDSENYNEPILPTLQWRIERAEYDMSGIVFTDKLSPYSGELQYPDVFGNMPIGLDGISPSFTFSRGVLDVTDEPIPIDIIFYTESENYKIPEGIVRSVRITPKPIYAVWENTVLTYNEKEQAPRASSEYTAITVKGGGINAGCYLAYAESVSKNYTVVNSECEYVIEKAENAWVRPPVIKDIFESGELVCEAEALGGYVSVKFYRDEAHSEEIEKPTESGIYYAVVYSTESDNYLSLVGEPLRFEIKEVCLIGISASVLGSDFCAFERLDGGDFSVTLHYNDGTEAPLESGSAAVIYQNGSSLRRRDTSVKFSYLGFEASCDISVGLAEYDLSGVIWENGRVSYNGKEQRISVSGLPEGVFVREYEGGVGVSVGEYPVRVYLDYDEENYYPPDVLQSKLVIEKCLIATPIFESVVYDGKAHLPTAPENTYIAEAAPSAAGVYELTLRLSDGECYTFLGEKNEITVSFEIEKATLTLTVDNIRLHLFEELPTPSYTVLGLIGEDTSEFEFSEINGILYAAPTNPNYSVKIIGGEIEKLSYPTRDYLNNIFICILLFAIFALIAFVIATRREQIFSYISGVRSLVQRRRESFGRTVATRAKIDRPQPIYLLPEAGGEYSSIMSVDMPKADSLISDTMAKNLIKRSYDSILTSGHKKAIVNIGAVSSAFSAGDTVNINKLKEKGLVREDAGYVKILADGVIDKPLFVYANAFSLSAVKMIALTGGEAVKVTTAKKRKRQFNIIT